MFGALSGGCVQDVTAGNTNNTACTVTQTLNPRHLTQLAACRAVGKRPDPKALDAVLSEAWSVLQQPDADPALRRATFVLAAAAARSSDPVRKELVVQVQRAITAADNLAGLAGALGGGKGKGSPAKPAALNWDLQHTAFLAVRLAAAATGADSISRSAFVGVGSADPVGARHSLALVADVAYRVRSGGSAAAAVADAVEQFVELGGWRCCNSCCQAVGALGASAAAVAGKM